jgi:preprotein translocase subunit YajC
MRTQGLFPQKRRLKSFTAAAIFVAQFLGFYFVHWTEQRK